MFTSMGSRRKVSRVLAFSGRSSCIRLRSRAVRRDRGSRRLGPGAKPCMRPTNSAASRDLDLQPMRSIPIDVIRAFVAVVESRGFTRAAEDLGRSQPTDQPAGEAVRGAGRGAAVREGGALRADGGWVGLLRLRQTTPQAARRDARRGRALENARGAAQDRHAGRVRLSTDARARRLLRRGAPRGLRGGHRRVRALGRAFRAERSRRRLSRRRQRRRRLPALAAPLGWLRADGWRRACRNRRPVGARAVGPAGEAVAAVKGRRAWVAGSAEAAAGALRAADRPFDIVCASADFAVRSAAVAAGFGIAPMIDGLPPGGLTRSADPSLPHCRRSSFRWSRAAKRWPRRLRAGRPRLLPHSRAVTGRGGAICHNSSRAPGRARGTVRRGV